MLTTILRSLVATTDDDASYGDPLVGDTAVAIIGATQQARDLMEKLLGGCLPARSVRRRVVAASSVTSCGRSPTSR
jgi:hypothetical protein